MRQLFDRALAAKQFQSMATDGHPLRSMPIMAALRRGEIVGLHGDRRFGGADLRCRFSAARRGFPPARIMLAAVTGAPIFQIFVVREAPRPIPFLHVSPPNLSPATPCRPESVRPPVAEYATRLADVARQYPFQWFNIYPFWDETPAAEKTETQPTS